MLNDFLTENVYPSTDLANRNLDFMIRDLQKMMVELKTFVSINSVKYADPIRWDITRQYEKNTIVIDPLTGTAYISVAAVPIGVALTRTEYWTPVFDLEQFVTKGAKNFTSRFEEQTTLTATFPTPVNGWLVWNSTLYRALTNIVAGDQYTPDSNIKEFTMEDVIGHPEDVPGYEEGNNVCDLITGLYNLTHDALEELLNFIGNLADLQTEDKSSLVAAVNEIISNIGELSDLQTEDKSSIVAAINENVDATSTLDEKVGELSDLQTEDKSSIVAAINENVDATSTLDEKVGDLANLHTTDKTSIVNAINDIASIVPAGFGINVKDYGAVGDGVTNDSVAIQAALDEGGIIYFPTGDYLIETTLVPKAYSTLIGNDRQHVRIIAKECDAFNLNSQNMVSIMNLCVKPYDDNIGLYTAFDLNGCNRPTIKNVIIGKFNYGIYSHTGTNWDVYLEDVYFSEPNVGLYHPDLSTQLHVIAHKCYFDSNYNSRCIDLHSTRGEFYDCRFGCRNTRAVNVTDLSNLLFIGCDFEADSAITMDEAPNNAMIHIGEGYYYFLKCTFIGNDYFTAGYLLQLWGTVSCQFIDSTWNGVAHQYKFNIDTMYGGTVGSVYFNGIAFNPLYEYIKTNKPSIIKFIRNRYYALQEYASRPSISNIIPYNMYYNINAGFHEYYDNDAANWEILDHHTWTP